MADTLECFVCGTKMKNISPKGFQPTGGTSFATYGHYGSTLFDPVDGTFLEIAICDPCLKFGRFKDRVQHGRWSHQKPAEYATWKQE